MTELQANGSDLEDSIGKLKQREEQLQSALSTIKSLSRDKETLEQTAAELESQVQEASTRDLQLRTSHRRELEWLTAQLNEQKSQNAILEEELQTATGKVSQLRSEVDRKENEIAQSHQAFHLENETPRNMEDHGDNDEQILELQEKLREAEKQRKDLELQLGQAKRMVTEAQRDRSELHQLLEERTMALNRTKEELDQVVCRLDDLEEENAQLKTHVDQNLPSSRREGEPVIQGSVVPALRLGDTQRTKTTSAAPTHRDTFVNLRLASQHEVASETPRCNRDLVEMTELQVRPRSNSLDGGAQSSYRKMSADSSPNHKKQGCPCTVS